MQRLLKVASVLAVAFVVGLAFSVADTYAKEPKIPDDFKMTDVGDAGAVTFSHAKHKASKAGEEVKCTSCHPKVFKMKMGQTKEKMGAITMKAMETGQFCGSCHDGKMAVGVAEKNNCAKCHVK